MIRVLHVIGSLNIGGSQSMIMELYRNIDKKKIQFDFIIHHPEELYYQEEIESMGGRIYSLPNFNGLNYFEYVKEWREFFLKHNHYKILHGHVRSTASIYMSIAKRYGIKTISHSHSTSSGQGIQALIKDIMQFPIRFIADYFFACSHDAAVWLFGKKVLSNPRFSILNNAIDTKKYNYNKFTREKKRKEFNIKNSFVIGQIGRFSSPKNHLLMLDIFKEVLKKNDTAILMLVGEGELRGKIEEKIIRLGIESNVILTGERSDVPDILQAIDIFVCPSMYEGLGIVAVEAQAAGLKCIVSDTLPIETNMTPLIKYISLNESTMYWAEEILEYASGYCRETQYEEIKRNGYDIKSTSKYLAEFYENIF